MSRYLIVLRSNCCVGLFFAWFVYTFTRSPNSFFYKFSMFFPWFWSVGKVIFVCSIYYRNAVLLKTGWKLIILSAWYWQMERWSRKDLELSFTPIYYAIKSVVGGGGGRAPPGGEGMMNWGLSSVRSLPWFISYSFFAYILTMFYTIAITSDLPP